MKHFREIPLDLYDRLEYDESSKSYLRWVNNGKEAGAWNGRYFFVRTRKQTFYNHRVIWALHFGEPGDLTVDHIDRNTLNNSIDNLRLATFREQNCNQGRNQTRPTHPVEGVWWWEKAQRWRVKVDGEYHGVFKSEEDAIQCALRVKSP